MWLVGCSPAPGLVHTPRRKRCFALAAMACSSAVAGPSSASCADIDLGL